MINDPHFTQHFVNNRRTKMTNKLLGIIAINLTIITGLMVLQSIPTATAQSGVQKVAICDVSGQRCADMDSIKYGILEYTGLMVAPKNGSF